MRLGFGLPQFGQVAGEAGKVASYASRLEAAGAASFWVGDRWLAPTDPSVGYQDGDTIPAEFASVLDPFLVLTAAATATSTALLGSNVLIAPLYPPVLLARQLTTIDRISGGRLLSGLGIGWSPEEYTTAGAPFTGRGAQLDEILDVLGTLWTDDPAEHHGARWEVPRSRFTLKPLRPRIYLGGFGAAALRRVGRRADGWLPAAIVNAGMSTDELRQARAVIDDAAREAGRDPGGIDTVLRLNVPAGTALQRVTEAVRMLHGETGIEHVFVDPMYLVSTVDEEAAVAERLLDDLRDLIG